MNTPLQILPKSRFFLKRPSIYGFLIIVILLIVITNSNTQSVRSTPPLEKPPVKMAANISTCQVDADKIINSVNRGLFGTNIEWFNNGNGLIKPGIGLDLDFARLAKDQGISLIRFPGGTLSDYYHWVDGTGPLLQRPKRKHFTDPGRSENNFGSPELIRFCLEANAHPLITVNAGTGTAEEAADWVKYFNSPDNARRKADGFPLPLNIFHWEIGNELYLPGNPGDLKIAVTPEVYAERFLEFSAKMRKADPHISLMGIGVARANSVPLEHEDWSEVLLKKAAGDLDYIAVHNSYFPMIFVDKDLSLKQVYQAMWAGPEAVDRSLEKLENLILKYQKERDIGIAITEWGMLFSFESAWINHIKTMGSAVYAGRMMQVYMQHPKVRIANYFKMTDATPMGWISYDKNPKIPYYVIQMFARHFGTRVVASTTDSSTFNSAKLRVMESETNVPEITSLASLDDSGKTLFVNFVSRSWETTHLVSLNLNGFQPTKNQAIGWILSTPNVTDHNGRDLPPDWNYKTDEPQRTKGFSDPIKIEKIMIDISQPIQIPPHSILTLEISSKP